jgi:hypothetical protein
MTGTTRVPTEQTEIKINVGADEVSAAEQTLGLRPDDAQSMTVWFGEYLRGRGGPTALPLLTADVILRLRRKRDDSDDATVKLRLPATGTLPEGLPEAAKSSKWTFKVEGDWAGERQLVSASAVTEIGGGLPDDPSEKGLSSFLSRKQKGFLRQVTDLPIDLRELDVLGPIRALKWEDEATESIGVGVVAERWEVGDLRFLELSLRVPTAEAEEAQRSFDALIRGRGVVPAAVAETKTRQVLEYLSSAAARGSP